MFISLILIWSALAAMSAGSTITASRVQQREAAQVLKTNGSLDLGWNDAELFSQ